MTLQKLAIICISMLLFCCSCSDQIAKAPEPGSSAPRVMPTAEEVLNETLHRDSKQPEIKYVTNFASGRLSKVPAPGIHPRILMSPEDLPGIRKRMKTTEAGKRALELLEITANQSAAGNNDKKKWYIHSPEIHWRIDCEAFYCLITENDERGKKVAQDIVDIALAVEPDIDDYTNSPYGDNLWISGQRTALGWEIHLACLGYAYDYAYNWMTDEQRSIVRRVIAKMTAGKYNHGMELPRHWRIWNWAQFSLNFGNLALAIEGEEGFDQRVVDVWYKAAEDFITHKISPSGVDYESTGYGNLAWGGGGAEALLAAARRGNRKLMAHSHIYNSRDWFIGMQASVNGPWQCRGDGSGSSPDPTLTAMMKYFYPNDRAIDYVWRSTMNKVGMYKAGEKPVGRFDIRQLPIFMLCAAQPIGGDSNPIDYTQPKKFKHSKSYYCPDKGFFAARSSWQDYPLHVTMVCRTDLIMGGHDGPDVGDFSLSADGVNWAQVGTKYEKSSYFRNLVNIDGQGQGYGTMSGKFIGVYGSPKATAAACDASYGYSWKFGHTKAHDLKHPALKHKLYERFYDGIIDYEMEFGRTKELDPSPHIKEFYEGYAHWDVGLWCGENRRPPERTAQTPVEKAFRTIQLARGKHPYVIVIDDIKKDDAQHKYEWVMQVPDNIDVVKTASELNTDSDILLFKGAKEGPAMGNPQMLIRSLYREKQPADTPPALKKEKKSTRVFIPSTAVEPKFKTLLFPHKHGQQLPKTTWNNAGDTLTVELPGQKDVYTFGITQGGRTVFKMTRNGRLTQLLDSRPQMPTIETPQRKFTDRIKVAINNPSGHGIIRYTTDGSEPLFESPIYKKPITLTETTTVKAAVINKDWLFGPKKSNPVIVKFEKQTPATPEPANPGQMSPGLKLAVYEQTSSYWDDRGFFDPTISQVPNLANYEPIFNGTAKTIETPTLAPTRPLEDQAKGFFVYDGSILIPADGTYTFNFTTCAPCSLKIAGQPLIDEVGPYNTAIKERSAQITLKQGLHEINLMAADPIFYLTKQLPKMDISLTYQKNNGPKKPVTQKMLYHK